MGTYHRRVVLGTGLGFRLEAAGRALAAARRHRRTRAGIRGRLLGIGAHDRLALEQGDDLIAGQRLVLYERVGQGVQPLDSCVG